MEPRPSKRCPFLQVRQIKPDNLLTAQKQSCNRQGWGGQLSGGERPAQAENFTRHKRASARLDYLRQLPGQFRTGGFRTDWRQCGHQR